MPCMKKHRPCCSACWPEQISKFEPQKKDAVRRPFSYFIPCAWAIGYLPSGTERPCAHSPYKVFLKLLISGQHTLQVKSPYERRISAAWSRAAVSAADKKRTRHRKIAKAKGA